MSFPRADLGAGGASQAGGEPAGVLIFVIEGREYALPLEAIAEVIDDRAPTTVPGARPDILGILPWRGRMVTILDGRARLGLPTRDPEAGARLIIVRHEGEWTALLVDRVSRVQGLAGGCDDGVLLLEPAILLQEER